MINYKSLKRVPFIKDDMDYLKTNLKDEQVGQVLTAVINYLYYDIETEFSDALVDVCYQNVLSHTKEEQDRFVQNCKRPGDFLTNEEVVREYQMVGNVGPADTKDKYKGIMAYEILDLLLFQPGVYDKWIKDCKIVISTNVLKSGDEIKNSFNLHAPHFESKYQVSRETLQAITRDLYDAFKLTKENVSLAEAQSYLIEKENRKNVVNHDYSLDNEPKPYELYRKTCIHNINGELMVGYIPKAEFETVLNQYKSFDEAKTLSKKVQEWLADPIKSGVTQVHMKHYYRFKDSIEEPKNYVGDINDKPETGEFDYSIEKAREIAAQQRNEAYQLRIESETAF